MKNMDAKVRREAIRYLYAHANSGNKTAQKITRILSSSHNTNNYDRIYSDPYANDGNIYWLFNSAIDYLNRISVDWYNCLSDDDDLNELLNSITNYGVVPNFKTKLSDEAILGYFNMYKMLYKDKIKDKSLED